VTAIQFGDIDSYNQPGGTILPSIGALTDLTEFDAGENNLHGTIPESITTLKKLVILALSDNNLSGPLPANIGDLTSLRGLAVENNHLTGTIPASFGKFTSVNGTLKQLSMYCNNFTGVLPSIDWEAITIDPTSPTGHSYTCFLSPPHGESCDGPFPSNEWACPLPVGAADYCKAKCKSLEQ
jgi:hypothetical protein